MAIPENKAWQPVSLALAGETNKLSSRNVADWEEMVKVAKGKKQRQFKGQRKSILPYRRLSSMVRLLPTTKLRRLPEYTIRKCPINGSVQY